MEVSNDFAGFDFSLEPKYTKFTIGETAYILREASEDAHTSYKNFTMRSMRFTGVEGGEKKAQLMGGAEADTQLLSKCLFRLKRMGEQQVEEPVPFEEISLLPRRITKRLYNWVRANSAMDEEEETVEFLQKRIKSDQQKLYSLLGEGNPGKGEQSSISGIST